MFESSENERTPAPESSVARVTLDARRRVARSPSPVRLLRSGVPLAYAPVRTSSAATAQYGNRRDDGATSLLPRDPKSEWNASSRPSSSSDDVGVSRRSAAGRGGAEEDGGQWRRRTSADVVECAGGGIIFFVAVARDRKK